MDATQEDVMGLNPDAGFEILTGELEARLQELENEEPTTKYSNGKCSCS
jgi:hypothetical protein